MTGNRLLNDSTNRRKQMDELMKKLAITFDVAEVTPDMPLDELSWDSMAMLGVIALGRTRGKKITADMLKEMKTVGDVIAAL